MRVLFDQATPVPLRRFLTGHSVSTAAHEGWDKLQNGDLLDAAEAAGFEIFLTTTKTSAISKTSEDGSVNPWRLRRPIRARR
jgi:hypothetical protein